MTADATNPAPRNVCFTMHGIGVSGGIAIGHAHLFLGMSTEVDHYELPAYDVSREQRRSRWRAASAPTAWSSTCRPRSPAPARSAPPGSNSSR